MILDYGTFYLYHMYVSLTVQFVLPNNRYYNRFLTDGVGKELKSVRSKEHLGFTIHVTHHHGEAKRLRRVKRSTLFITL